MDSTSFAPSQLCLVLEEWLALPDSPPIEWVLGERFLAGALTAGASRGREHAAAVMAVGSALAICTGREVTEEPVHRPGGVLYLHHNDANGTFGNTRPSRTSNA